MSNKKVEIMEAYIQLLDESPAKRITVNDIVARCGVSRNTFYYYYSDISSLIKEIEAYWIKLIRMPDEVKSIFDCMKPLQEYSLEHRNGILRAYRTSGQQHFTGVLNRLWEAVLRGYVESLKEFVFSEEDRVFLIRFFKCLFVGMTLDWLDADMSYDLTATGRRACHLMQSDEMRRKFMLNC